MDVIFDNMKNQLLPFVALCSLVFSACTDQRGEQMEYAIYQVGFQPNIGSVFMTELEDGEIEINIELAAFSRDFHQAHLHFGDINTLGELAYRLNDLNGATGQSKTVLKNVKLSDGSKLTFQRLMEMDGSIKVHSADPDLKSAVVAFGNIGRNENLLSSGITVCTGH